jgi:hypothetical protein
MISVVGLRLTICGIMKIGMIGTEIATMTTTEIAMTTDTVIATATDTETAMTIVTMTIIMTAWIVAFSGTPFYSP